MDGRLPNYQRGRAAARYRYETACVRKAHPESNCAVSRVPEGGPAHRCGRSSTETLPFLPSFPSVLLSIQFYNGEFEFFFYFFRLDRRLEELNNRKRREEIVETRGCTALLLSINFFHRISFPFFRLDRRPEELKTLEAIIGKEEIGDKKKCKSVFEWRKERNQI